MGKRATVVYDPLTKQDLEYAKLLLEWARNIDQHKIASPNRYMEMKGWC